MFRVQSPSLLFPLCQTQGSNAKSAMKFFQRQRGADFSPLRSEAFPPTLRRTPRGSGINSALRLVSASPLCVLCSAIPPVPRAPRRFSAEDVAPNCTLLYHGLAVRYLSFLVQRSGVAARLAECNSALLWLRFSALHCNSQCCSQAAKNLARVLFPLSARNERGEGQGEGRPPKHSSSP